MTGALQGGADETDAHQGGADVTGALQGGTDETDAHQGGADGTDAHQGGADGTDAHQGGTDMTGALQARSRRDRRPPGRSRDPWPRLGPRGNGDTRGRESTFGFRNRGREFKRPW